MFQLTFPLPQHCETLKIASKNNRKLFESGVNSKPVSLPKSDGVEPGT